MRSLPYWLLVYEVSEEELHNDSTGSPANRTTFSHAEGTYRFLHDRVQEAAYSLIPEESARRGASSNRQAARSAHSSREAGAGDLRDRQSAQPRRGLDHLTGRARATGRAQPDRGQAGQGFYGLRLSAQLSHRRCGIVGQRTAGSAGPSSFFALELHRAECEFLTGDLVGGCGRAPHGAFAPRSKTRSILAAVACLRVDAVHDPRSERPRVSTSCLDYLRHPRRATGRRIPTRR